jgi:hypothetical protein
VWFGLKDKPGEAAAEYERTRAGASSEVPLPRERPSIQPQVLSEAREGARPESGAPILHPQTRRKVRREISRQHNAFQDHAEHHGRHFAAHGSAGHVS